MDEILSELRRTLGVRHYPDTPSLRRGRRIRHLTESTPIIAIKPEDTTKDALTEILRSGAQRMLAAALEAEVESYVGQFAYVRDEAGHRLVVRNGHSPSREVQSGVGPIEVSRPRANDKRLDEEGNRITFSSSILPPYLRRTKTI